MQPSTEIRTIKAGDPAPNSHITSETGQEIELSTFWSSSPNGAMVVLLRNFGCIFCRDQAKRLRDAYAEFTAREINLVAIGVGRAQDAVEFADWLKLPFPVLGQPDTSVHAAWGLGRSAVEDMIRPDLMRAGFRAVRNRSMQGKATGDSRQLPGTFLVDRQGIVLWSRPGEHPGDNPPISRLLATIDRLHSAERR